MPRIIFSHPEVDKILRGKGHGAAIRADGQLSVRTGANEIKWGYTLNSVTYPTYAGEVVQVLSASIDDLNISGEVPNYATMEDIYRWFLTYMTIATQGAKGESYNEDLVTLWYPHREWMMKIRPKALPGYRNARDLTVPMWQITAAIIQGDPEQEAATLQGALDGLEDIHAGIGYKEYNPFSAPTKRRTNYQSVRDELDDIGENLNTAYDQIVQGNLDILTQPFQAKPPGERRK